MPLFEVKWHYKDNIMFRYGSAAIIDENEIELEYKISDENEWQHYRHAANNDCYHPTLTVKIAATDFDGMECIIYCIYHSY